MAVSYGGGGGGGGGDGRSRGGGRAVVAAVAVAVAAAVSLEAVVVVVGWWSGGGRVVVGLTVNAARGHRHCPTSPKRCLAHWWPWFSPARYSYGSTVRWCDVVMTRS